MQTNTQKTYEIYQTIETDETYLFEKRILLLKPLNQANSIKISLKTAKMAKGYTKHGMTIIGEKRQPTDVIIGTKNKNGLFTWEKSNLTRQIEITID